ncbi:reverse transcriptase domain-containing protein [Tanacetum coccineum]
MDGCTKSPQLEEGENLNTGALGTGRTPLGRTSALVRQAQGGSSLAFVKENIDVLRTMIKELDNRGQEKVTPRKLFNEESGGAGSENSQMSPSAEEVGGYSSDGSSRSRSIGRSRSARKNQKSVSKKKGISKSHRSVRSEARSRSKSKSVKSKPQSVRASRRKSSSDSGYDTVSDSGSEDLSMPYRRPKPMPFTSRITRFRYHRRAKLPPNVRVYEGNKDPKDHLSIFSAAAEQEEWPMPVWCKMFRQTLSGSARNWFDSLDPKSVDGFEELSSKFLEEFSQQKRYDKDPTEIHGIKRKPNEGLQAFMDRFKAESAHIKGAPSVLRISAFIHGHGHPELAKKINDKIPKMVDEMWAKVRAFIRVETAADTTKAIRSPRRLHTFDEDSKGNPRYGQCELTSTASDGGDSEEANHEQVLGLGKVGSSSERYQARRPKEQGLNQRKKKVINMLMNFLVVVEAMIEGFRVRRTHVDGGSSSKVMYEHCFRNLSYRMRSRLRESRIPLVGFSGEVSYLMGVIDLEVTIGERGRTRTVIMEFTMVKSPSPYNALLGRTGIRSLGAIASTIHSMMKFSTSNGIATISTTRKTLRECRQIEEAQDLKTRSQRPGKEPMQLDDMEGRRQPDKGRKPPKSGTKEKIVVNDNYPEQLVTIGGGLSAKCRHALIHTLRKNVDIFAWTPADMTGILRAITEHSLDTYPHIKPKAQKKRGLDPDIRKVVTDEVNEWLKARIPPNIDDKEGRREYGFPYGRGSLLLHEDSFWSQEYRDNISEASLPSRSRYGINMKLNPKKCSFGMEEGKFLGYIVTSEGIRANPKKSKAVMDMPSPKTLKQMQSLKAVEAAFLEIKKLVSELPTLTTPKKGETLMMYLDATNKAVSAVLLTERDGRQMPIHYVSQSLQGAETNYAPIEKLSLALVHAARRLRRYFQAHPIKVISDSLIGQVLNNSGASGRLAEWAVELGAYGITYVPRVAVKGQVLADFLADTPAEINVTPEVANNPKVEDILESSNAREDLTPGLRAWRLYTDGASNNEGSEAGLILIALDNVEYSYELRLNFSNSNKDVEYEALLAGLRIANEMQVKDIHAFVDSKLVASQVEGSYEAKGERMIKYREKVLELAGVFNRFRITHIPRAENKKVDALSMLAAEGPTWMTPIRNYLEKEKLPKDPVDARTLMEKIENYTMEYEVLYRKSYLVPLMRCVGPLQANYIIREVHMGSCGMHDGPSDGSN